jgi:DNA-binding MarR family transcriptional regulator
MSDHGTVDEEKRATLRRFAALGAATSFTGNASAADSADSDARSAIAGYLATTPGAHFSKIRDDLKLGTGEAQHHLRELVDEGAVESHKDGDYRRYFPANRFAEFEQVALATLRRKTPRHMIIELLENPGSTGTALADAIGVSRPTVSTHVNDLTTAGIVERDDGYHVRRPEMLITLIVQYADSFDRRAKAFASDASSLISYDPQS